MTEEKKAPTGQEFAEAYQALVNEYGYQIVAVPVWKLRDDGTYSMVVKMQVVRAGQDNQS